MSEREDPILTTFGHPEAADDAFFTSRPERAVVADACRACRVDERVARGALAVAFLAQPADCRAGLFET
ncbi:hypothetical protein KL918_000062 [Ogataea parapolymorpha]|nr:hypothetical protein KL918_000062 [Ogataea parapolymorpha]KAG7873146.1 hypothetical protein KL916_002447 [Ogataea parapolymorpha]